MDSNYIMIAEEEFDEMLRDLEYFQALNEMLTEILEEECIEVTITEGDVWDYVRGESDD